MRYGYGYRWRIGRLSAFLTTRMHPTCLYIDWRINEPGRRWRIAMGPHLWRPLHATPTRQWRAIGLDIDWYAPGND